MYSGNSNQFSSNSNQFGGLGTGTGGLGSNFGAGIGGGIGGIGKTNNFGTNFPPSSSTSNSGLGMGGNFDTNKFSSNFDNNKFGISPSPSSSNNTFGTGFGTGQGTGLGGFGNNTNTSNFGGLGMGGLGNDRFGTNSNTPNNFQTFQQKTVTTTVSSGGQPQTTTFTQQQFSNIGNSGNNNNFGIGQDFGARNFQMPIQNPPQQQFEPMQMGGFNSMGASFQKSKKKDKDSKKNDVGGLGKGKKTHGMNDHLGEKFRYLLSQCEQQQRPFSDSDFPANQKSLAQDPSDLDYFGDVKGWKRAKDFMQGQQFMFKDGISPADIQQAGLGDCYLLSTFAAIAEFPDRIEKLFNSKEPNSWGVYSVNICWRGVMQEVCVDDQFAVDKKGQPFSLQTNGNELWVLVLEKAWAKLHKSYFRIDGQLAREALHDFTGAPARTIYTKGDKEDLWRRLLEGENNGYIMCAGTIGDDSGKSDPMRKKGLVGGHCYALISAHMENIKGRRVRLIKLRNPWGKFEWKGAYSEEDTVWNDATQSVRRRVKIEKKDDGIFIMQYEDLLTNFDAVQICYSRDDYLYSGISVKTNFQQGAFFKIKLHKDGFYFFQVSQISIRCFDLDYQDDEPHYSPTFMIIAPRPSPANPIICCKGTKRDLSSYKYIDKPIELEKGKYIAYVRVNWLKNATHSFGFGVYGPSDVKIKQMKKKFENFEQLTVSCYDHEKYGKSKAKYDIENVPVQ